MERQQAGLAASSAAVLAAGSWLLSFLTGLFAAVLIAYSGYVLYDTFYTESRAYADSVDLLQFRPSVLSESEDVPEEDPAELLAAINPDYSAWLTIYDTRIDYPVVQGSDDLYYASHDVYGDVSLTGAIYLAAGNTKDFSDNYNVIYGHHMDNGAMFGTLDAFRDADYFDEHRDGVIAVGSTVYDVTVFAVVQTHAYDREIYNVGDRDLAALIEYVKTVSVHYDGEPVKGATKIVALSTCAGATTDGRLLVFGVMTERSGDGPTPTPTPTEEATPTPKPTPFHPATATPAPEDPMERFTPRGNTRGSRAWSLVDLISMICTVYLFFPLFRICAKFTRPRRLRKLGKKGFAHKFRIGLILELVFAVFSVLLFLWTQDLRTPMVLIDRWTPLFLLTWALCWVADFVLIRYRGKYEDDPPQEPPQEPSEAEES